MLQYIDEIGPKSGYSDEKTSWFAITHNITMGLETHESAIQKFNHCLHNDFPFIKLIEWKSLDSEGKP